MQPDSAAAALATEGMCYSSPVSLSPYLDKSMSGVSFMLVRSGAMVCAGRALICALAPCTLASTTLISCLELGTDPAL